MRLPGLISQSLVPRLVRSCTTLVENRPYSAANGLASSSTDSRLWPGNSRSKSPDEGSMRLVLLIWSAPCVGCPPLARSRPSGPRTTPGSSGSRLWKSSPSSGAMSRTDPDSMSLVETGCTLWVGDVGARTSTLGRDEGQAEGRPAPAPFRRPHVERRRCRGDESRTRRLHDVAAGRHVRETSPGRRRR